MRGGKERHHHYKKEDAGKAESNNRRGNHSPAFFDFVVIHERLHGALHDTR